MRTARVASKYPADISSNHPCAQRSLGVCAPLSLPDRVLSKRVLLLDEEDRPLANVDLEFHAYSMGPGELFGAVHTDGEGGADLGPIYAAEEARGFRARRNYVILNRSMFTLDLTPRTNRYKSFVL